MMDQVLQATLNGYKQINLCHEAFRAGQDIETYLAGCTRVKSYVLNCEQPLFLGPFRGTECNVVMSLIGQRIDEARLIVQLRDPLSILESLHYSVAESHGLPGPGPQREVFLNSRKLACAMSTDEYALAHISWLNESIHSVFKLSDALNHRIILNYEDYIANTSQWLTSLLSFLDLQVSAKILRELDQLTKLIGPNINREHVMRPKAKYSISEGTKQRLSKLIINPFLSR